MSTIETINDRILQLIDALGITKTAFAKKLKVTQQYISKLVNTGTPSEMLIEDISEKFDVNEDWLKTGKGEMFIPENDVVKKTAILLGKKDTQFEALIETYSKLDERNRKLLIELGETLLRNDEKKE